MRRRSREIEAQLPFEDVWERWRQVSCIRKSHAKREQSLVTSHQVSTFLGDEKSARSRHGLLGSASPMIRALIFVLNEAFAADERNIRSIPHPREPEQ